MAQSEQDQQDDTGPTPQGGSDRGFAAMDDDKQREIASQGGASVADEDRIFSKDPELAAEAGREGGQASGGVDSDPDDGGDGRFEDGAQSASEAGERGDDASPDDQ